MLLLYFFMKRYYKCGLSLNNLCDSILKDLFTKAQFSMLSKPVIDDYIHNEVYCGRLHKDRKSGY